MIVVLCSERIPPRYSLGIGQAKLLKFVLIYRNALAQFAGLQEGLIRPAAFN